MQLDTNLFSADENRSSDEEVALQHPGCPVNEICYYLVVGYAKQCPHLNHTINDTLECIHSQ